MLCVITDHLIHPGKYSPLITHSCQILFQTQTYRHKYLLSKNILEPNILKRGHTFISDFHISRIAKDRAKCMRHCPCSELICTVQCLCSISRLSGHRSSTIRDLRGPPPLFAVYLTVIYCNPKTVMYISCLNPLFLAHISYIIVF